MTEQEKEKEHKVNRILIIIAVACALIISFLFALNGRYKFDPDAPLDSWSGKRVITDIKD